MWFDRWIQEGYSVRQLSNQSSHQRTKLFSIIGVWLNTTPPAITDLSHHEHLLFDGTFVDGRISIVAAMDGNDRTIISGAYGVKENSFPEVCAFLHDLKDRGLDPKSVTVDGNPHVIKAFRTVWPRIRIQRCLVHIQRQGLMWCRQKPNRLDAQTLRKLFLLVPTITTKKERDSFLSAVQAWERMYGHSLARAPDQSKVGTDLVRARSMLFKAIPDMFHYLHDMNIPKTTNGLEGYFSRLQARYRAHRGLSITNRSVYFAWYFALCKR